MSTEMLTDGFLSEFFFGWISEMILLGSALFFLDAFLERKPKWTIFRLVLLLMIDVFAFIFVGFAVESFLPETSFVRSLIFVLRWVAAAALLTLPYQPGFFRKALSVLLLTFIMSIGETATALLIALLTDSTFDEMMVDEKINLIVVWSSHLSVSTLIFGTALLKRTNPKKLSRKSSPLVLLIFIFSVIMIAFLFFFFYTGDSFIGPDVMMISVIFIVAINILAYALNTRLGHAYEQNEAFALREQQALLREDYYQRIEVHQEEVRLMKKELQERLRTLDSRSRGITQDEFVSQIRETLTYLKEFDRQSFTTHPGLNALISAKYLQAQDKGILCDFEVKISEDIKVEEGDIVLIVGNVLDNAIEANEHGEGRKYIRFTLFSLNHSVALFCENAHDGAWQKDETRKADKINHGIGLSSIQAKVDKYQGSMEYRFDSYSFTIELSLFEPPED